MSIDHKKYIPQFVDKRPSYKIKSQATKCYHLIRGFPFSKNKIRVYSFGDINK